MASAATPVVSVADKLLPWATVAFGDGGVVELFRWDALQRLCIAWGWNGIGDSEAWALYTPPPLPLPHPRKECRRRGRGIKRLEMRLGCLKRGQPPDPRTLGRSPAVRG